MSPMRLSPTLMSPLKSDNSSGSRSPLFTSDKIYNKYEMVNDSFGSPDPKELKAKRVQNTCKDDQDCPWFSWNDPIIKNLQSQEQKLENFVPLSRIEPVPISMTETDLAIAYNTSPNWISYQYEKSGSPPRLSKTRKKLFSSPSHKREIKEDTDPEYLCNADWMSSMRATDLHWGRGSSPLRTKLKSSPRNKSRSSSPKKTKSKVFYRVEDGLINIKTPSKKNYEEDSYDDSSPKTKLINDLQESNGDLHTFQRQSKASYQNTDLRSNNESEYFKEISHFQRQFPKTTFEIQSFSRSPERSQFRKHNKLDEIITIDRSSVDFMRSNRDDR